MPSVHPSANPFQNRRMIHAAQDGMIITMRCNGCRRSVHFWASDLVKVVGNDHQLHIAPWPCARCKSTESISVSWRVPSPDFLNGLTIRRPVRQVVKWLWRNEKA